jgi:uncharacterized protein (DUF2235 family)
MPRHHTSRHHRGTRTVAIALCFLISITLVTTGAQAQDAPRVPRRLVLCLDGTWNSTFGETTRADGHKVLRPTNTLKLCRAVLPRDPETQQDQIVFYDDGVGSLAEYPGTANRILRFTDRVLGGAYGARFEANIEDALHFIQMNYEEGDEVYIFGFSRGAATARGLTQFLEWNHGVFAKDDAYYLPRFFREYINTRGAKSHESFRQEIETNRPADDIERRPTALGPSRPVTVTYMGVWDTVLALGSRFRAKGETTSAPGKSFHSGRVPPGCILKGRQALAIDEARFDFRPELWVESLPHQSIEQRWFSGVHSNVGGGYRYDGLANIPLRWIVEGAQDEDGNGLKFDAAYLEHFTRFPDAQLYDSSSSLYRFLEAIRFRKGKGKRPIAGVNAAIDRSVVVRMASPQLKRDETKGAKNTAPGPYRPTNVLQFLACQPDLDAYLQSLPYDLDEGETILTIDSLPADARTRIDQLRKNCATSGI